jgi:hypothetical protein
MKPEMIEIILNELLEEQKKENESNAEMVTVVKKLLDKMDALQQQIPLPENPGVPERIRAVQIGIKDILDVQQVCNKLIAELKEITTAQQLVVCPEPVTTIKHHYHYTAIATISVVFLASVFIFISMYSDKMTEVQNYKASDTKYRYLKLTRSTYLSRALTVTDSLYISDPKLMIRRVDSLDDKPFSTISTNLKNKSK